MLSKVMTIPNYTSDESRVSLKLKCNNTLTELDLGIVKSDIVGKFFKKLSSSSETEEIEDYLNLKYPGWSNIWKLSELI